FFSSAFTRPRRSTHFPYTTLFRSQSAFNRLQVRQTEVTVEIHETQPFGIAWWGDWHIGAAGVDYETFDRHRAIIAEEDGLYWIGDRKSTRLNSSHVKISYAVFCLK